MYCQYDHDPAIVSVNEELYEALISRPGEYPFTRGIHAEMYTKGKFPTVRKYGGFGSGEDLNQHLRSQIALKGKKGDRLLIFYGIS